MKQPTALAAALALALAATFASPLAMAQSAMKISISVGQNSHQGVGIDTFAKEVETRTGGRYVVSLVKPVITYWVRYREIKPGTAEVVQAYCHRMRFDQGGQAQ